MQIHEDIIDFDTSSDWEVLNKCSDTFKYDPHPLFLLVAHGSRREESNAEVARLSAHLQNRLNRYKVNYAFLELATPRVSDVLDRAIAQGVSSIVVFPYFLGSGVHVSEDLPKLLDATRAAHPEITIRQLPHFGADDSWLDWLAQKVMNDD